ncbi:MAG: hypothetical protein HY077_03645 [Elusimicrobia bacterium]|nr:hypothetical protein [Elusimicrobiota bacterium]
MAEKIARGFKNVPDPDELISQLQEHVLLVKSRMHRQAVDWKGYLAKSLFNRAKRLLRTPKKRLEFEPLEEASLQARTVSSRDFLDSLASDEILQGLLKVYGELDPHQQQLWDLLVEHQGNIRSAAKNIRKPQGTIQYQVEKLRKILLERGFSM